MESTSVASTFRFRDHQDMADSTESETSSDFISFSTENDDESELESMTGKGIKRLCAELVEIKAESDEDFRKSIFINYSAFVGICEEVKDMEKELMQLRSHVSTQKRLVKDLIDGAYLKMLSEETIESIIEESVCDESEPPCSYELEVRINDFSDILLDLLVWENKTDEAIDILKREEEILKRVEGKDNASLDVLRLYKSVISERKAVITRRLIMVAENTRTPAPELQKALVGLCRLDDCNLATQLLFKYYHSRLATGLQGLQSSQSLLHGVYISKLSKFVFSGISQAARSFEMLHEGASPYAAELVEWINNEIEVFVGCFTKHVKSISEISGGLSTAVEAVHCAMSYCSLLEAQRLLLRPCLIKLINPFVEEVLQMHTEHFKKVIGIFTGTDAWVLGRYLASGILNESYPFVIAGKQQEYCLLTNSGRKFVSLLQAVTEDVAPLVTLQMEGSILRGLINLFSQYIAILENAMTPGNVTEKVASRVISAESLTQQVSILANLSTLQHLFSSIVVNLLQGINSEIIDKESVDFEQRELGSCLLFIQEACNRLRDNFCQQFFRRMTSPGTNYKLIPKRCDGKSDPVLTHDMMPSAAFQVLFLELWKLNKLAEDNVFEVDWLMELLREVIGAVFVWISVNKDKWEADDGSLSFQCNQFVLDMHFLVEITKHGEYFSEKPSVLEALVNSVFASAGLDPKRDFDDLGWATKAAAEAIQRLLEIEKREFLSMDEIACSSEEAAPEDNPVEHAIESVEDEGSGSSDESVTLKEVTSADAPEVSNAGKEAPISEIKQPRNPPVHKDSGVDSSIKHLTDASVGLEEIESEHAAYDKFHFRETSLPDLLLSVGVAEASEVGLLARDGETSQHDEAESSINKPDSPWHEKAPLEADGNINN